MKTPQTTQEKNIITISGTINSYNYCELIMSKPNWETLSVSKGKRAIQSWDNPDDTLSQVIDNLDSAREAIQRVSIRVYGEMLKSERGKELIAKAERYNIPYDDESINWLDLIDLVKEYEELLQAAEECHIYWDLGEYDPIALRQEIEYNKSYETEAKKDLYDYYHSTRI